MNKFSFDKKALTGLLGALACFAFADIWTALTRGFYTPQYNLIFVNEIHGVNANILLLFAVMLSAFLLKLFARHKEPGIQPYLRTAVFAAVLIIMAVQLFNYSRYFATHYRVLDGKTTDERSELALGDLFTYPQVCKQTITGDRRAHLLTDIDLYTTTGAYEHLALSYHLYPIEIQLNPRQKVENHQKEKPGRGDPEFLLLFRKSGAAGAVPAGFEIIKTIDDKNLIARHKSP